MIESLNSPHIARVKALIGSRGVKERKNAGHFVAEGLQCAREALVAKSGPQVETVYLTANGRSKAEEIADLEIQRENAMTIIINERSSVSEKRAAIVAPIAQELQELYRKLAADNNGNGAAPLVGNECKGCHLTINTTEVGRIATLASDEVVRCEQCRCILVRG